MIDFENEFVDAVAKAVTAKFPKAEVVSEYVPKPSSFPHVYIRETDNSTDTRSLPLAGKETMARIVYTIDVHSNVKRGRKTQCKAAMAVVDDVMQAYGFSRTFCNPFPNENDASIYRIVARYTKLQPDYIIKI